MTVILKPHIPGKSESKNERDRPKIFVADDPNVKGDVKPGPNPGTHIFHNNQ